MTRGNTFGRTQCRHPACGGGEGSEFWIGDFRRAAEVNYLRRERKLAVFKALGWSGLIIIICASALSVVYAFGL